MTLRELMAKKIAHNGWLDYVFCTHSESPSEKSTATHSEWVESYSTWLSTLSDEEFLEAYDRICQIRANQDAN
jgi:hypothetical protein